MTSVTDDSVRDLQLAYQRLLALERFKSGFLARTSHELRSPINTIVSLHQLILEDLCEGPEEEKAFVEQSKDAALKMLSLFDRITAVSKLDVGREPAKIEAVDLSLLLPEIEMLTTLQAANQNIRYTVTSPADEVEIKTDAKWLKNIVVSLIQETIPNAKQVTLSVETTGVETTANTIEIVLTCDRSAPQLQAELATIQQATALPESSSSAPPHQLDPSRIELSTGLVLATADIALPLINGTFAITGTEEQTALRCAFSS